MHRAAFILYRSAPDRVLAHRTTFSAHRPTPDRTSSVLDSIQIVSVDTGPYPSAPDHIPSSSVQTDRSGSRVSAPRFKPKVDRSSTPLYCNTRQITVQTSHPSNAPALSWRTRLRSRAPGLRRATGTPYRRYVQGDSGGQFDVVSTLDDPRTYSRRRRSRLGAEHRRLRQRRLRGRVTA